VYNVGTLTLIASDISDNRSGHGGGLFNDAKVTADAASRIMGNSATTSGGGIYNDSEGTVTLANSAIVSDNSPTNCGGKAVPNCIG
jgi:predicted outer membrane repeat protein